MVTDNPQAVRISASRRGRRGVTIYSVDWEEDKHTFEQGGYRTLEQAMTFCPCSMDPDKVERKVIPGVEVYHSVPRGMVGFGGSHLEIDGKKVPGSETPSAMEPEPEDDGADEPEPDDEEAVVEFTTALYRVIHNADVAGVVRRIRGNDRTRRVAELDVVIAQLTSIRQHFKGRRRPRPARPTHGAAR
jgi:hypothetical protein